jgi:RNA polymerase sigma factor (sigma-70 family)
MILPDFFRVRPSLLVGHAFADVLDGAKSMKQSQPPTSTDAHLLIRFDESRDQHAFAELVRRHGSMVRATARRVLRSEDDVEEAFQATMFALAKAAGKLRHKAAVAGWLHKTAFRCAIAIHRSNVSWKQRADRMKEQHADCCRQVETTDPLLHVANEELERLVDEELASLSEPLREVIVLCELEGLTQREVAKQLDLPTSTINDRLRTARKLLHRRLVRRGATVTLSGLVARRGIPGEASGAMSEARLAEISARAALYAAGKSAAEIGVSATVFQIASKVTSVTARAKLITALLALAAIAMVPLLASLSQPGIHANTARASTIFIDRFDDGDFEDDSPVTWTRYENSRVSIGSAGLVLTGNSFPTAQVERLDMQDTSLRTEFLLRRGTGVAVYVRTAEQAGRKGYAAFLSSDGMATIRFDGTGEVLARQKVNVNPMKGFVSMQFDAIGEELKLWIWQPGDLRPITPLLQVAEDSGFVGDIAIGAIATEGQAEVVFRLVHLANAHIAIPKP